MEIVLAIGSAVCGFCIGFWVKKWIVRQQEKAFLEQQVKLKKAHQDKMEVVSNLAKTISHDLKNPLAVVYMSLENLEFFLEQDEVDKKLIQSTIDSIQKSAEKMKAFLDRLTSFNLSKEAFTEFDLQQAMIEAGNVVKEKAKMYGISIIIKRSKDPHFTQGRRSEVVQVFVNLLLNAIEAVRNTHEPRVNVVFEPGELVSKVVVHEFGKGISEEDIENIFEPFYTTKDGGRGMGIGLPICRSIMRSHGGEIHVSSDENQGTIFKAEFPVSGSENQMKKRVA